MGVKLVRGAYWEKEIGRANTLGYAIPVHRNKSETDQDFNNAMDLCLDHLDMVHLCAGTHNEESILYLTEQMQIKNLPMNHPNICFSQLYGMSDHISYNLAKAGYNVIKYLPYGPVKLVMPYLVRRAEENSAIAGQMGRELKMISREREMRKNVKLIAKP